MPINALILIPVALIALVTLLMFWTRPKKAAQAHRTAPPQAAPAPSPPVAKAPSPQPLWPPSRAAPGSADAIWETGARALMLKDGRMPDAILHCIVQAGGGDSPASCFDDIYLGAFRADKFLRLVVRDRDELDYDPAEHLHAWDVPFSEIFAIVCRERTKPGYPRELGFRVAELEGTGLSHAPYFQTRIYKVGSGMECRLLDQHDPRSTRPFEWLKENVTNSDARFCTDTEDNPTYGDTLFKVVGDSLDEYALALKSTSEAAKDREASREALNLTDAQLRTLRSAAAQMKFPARHYNSLKDTGLNDASENLAGYVAEFDRWYAELVGDSPEAVPREFRNYGRALVERLVLGQIAPRYYAILFYDNFPAKPASDGAAKAKVLQIVRWMRPGGGLLGHL